MFEGSVGTSTPPGVDRDPLAALFRPRAVAIVGASGRAANPFARPLHYLVEYGFAGDVYPVNPGYPELAGRTCYPSLADLPGPVDLVLMLVPARVVLEQLEAAAAAGARAVVVFASGFAETGPEGAALQRELSDAARRLGVRVLGPNCQGVIGGADHLFGTFTAALELGPSRAGGLAYVGQSGAVGGSILSLARERGLGIAAWASTGNQADLTAVELARFLADEPDVTAIALYLESSVDEAAFVDLAAHMQDLGKALVVLRSAVSAAGARAAASHTGAIIGDDAGYRLIVREHGVIEAQDVDDLIALSHGVTAFPPAAGDRVAVVTTSGGAGSLAADQLAASGLRVEDLAPGTQAALAELVPSFGAVANPVDVTAQIFNASDPSAFLEVLEAVTAADEVDAVLVPLTLVTGELADRTADGLVARWATLDKPVALVWMAGREQTEPARLLLREAGWPVFDSMRQAARVLAALHRPAWPAGPETGSDGLDLPTEEIARFGATLSGSTTEAEAGVLLDLAGVERPRSFLVGDEAAAAELAASLDEPSVLKIQSPHVLHKSDRGGVVLGVAPADLTGVFKDLMTAFADDAPDGVLVQELAPDGVELIVGITRSGAGVPMVTVGLGGYAAEIYRDTATAFAPVTPERAERMIRSLRAAPLLTGFRGSAPIDLAAAAGAVARLSALAQALGDALAELEVNPLRVTLDGRALALDVVLTSGRSPE